MQKFGCFGDKIALRTDHGKYVVAEDNGDANANRDVSDDLETFTMTELGADKIALKSYHNKYLVAEDKEWFRNVWYVNANRDKMDDWEKWTIVWQSEGKIALKSYHGKYLVAESNGQLNADRTSVNSWERFTVECKGAYSKKEHTFYNN